MRSGVSRLSFAKVPPFFKDCFGFLLYHKRLIQFAFLVQIRQHSLIIPIRLRSSLTIFLQQPALGCSPYLDFLTQIASLLPKKRTFFLYACVFSRACYLCMQFLSLSIFPCIVKSIILWKKNTLTLVPSIFIAFDWYLTFFHGVRKVFFVHTC